MRIITLWAVIVLTFAVTTSADAQFGNILNKAKKAVKEKESRKPSKRNQRAVDVGWTYTDAKGQKWLAYTTLMQKAVYKGLTVTYVNQFMFSGGFKTMKLK